MAFRISNQLKGKRIELISTSAPYTNLRPDDLGTIDFVDDMWTIHVTWDNGSTLGLVPGEDHTDLLANKQRRSGKGI